MFYKFMRFAARVFFYALFKFEYHGVENIPQSGGYILICNHVTAPDPAYVAFKVKRQIHFMAKAELYANAILNWMGNALGAFKVERGKGDMGMVNAAIDCVKQGEILGIFPEGTRAKEGKPLRPKSGAAMIAKAAQADILPCAIVVEGGKLRFRGKITVTYGKLIAFAELGLDDESPSAIKKATKIMWNRVLNLLGVEEIAY